MTTEKTLADAHRLRDLLIRLQHDLEARPRTLPFDFMTIVAEAAHCAKQLGLTEPVAIGPAGGDPPLNGWLSMDLQLPVGREGLQILLRVRKTFLTPVDADTSIGPTRERTSWFGTPEDIARIFSAWMRCLDARTAVVKTVATKPTEEDSEPVRYFRAIHEVLEANEELTNENIARRLRINPANVGRALKRPGMADVAKSLAALRADRTGRPLTNPSSQKRSKSQRIASERVREKRRLDD